MEDKLTRGEAVLPVPGFGPLTGDGGRIGPTVEAEPAPLSPTICGLPAALSEMARVPVLIPDAIGLKVTEIAHLAPALKVVPQALVWEKSPPVVIIEIVTEAVPVLVSVTVWALLLVPNI